MSITDIEADRLASLSKLRFTGEEKTQLIKEFDNILQYVSAVKSIDTKGIKPCTDVSGITNAVREDIVLPSMPPDKLFASAPSVEDTSILVPKVME